MRLDTLAWLLGTAGAGMLLVAAFAYDVGGNPGLAGLVGLLGLLLLSQAWRLGRMRRRIARIQV